MNISFIGSPNYTKGREGQKVTGVICHWMAGNLASADATFQNRSRNTSAHFGVEDTTVHQYVNTDDTAYQAGNWTVNTQTIGIEHSAQPGRDASQATLDTSAQLIADMAKKYGFAINSSTIRPHRAIVATQCPGTINVQYLIDKANTLAGNPQSQPQPSIPSPAVSLETVTVTTDTLNVRSQPNTSSAVTSQLKKGDTFQIVGRVQGQSVSGVSTWVHSKMGHYVWAGGLNGQSSPASSKSGTARVTANMNVRAEPNTSSKITSTLKPGDTFKYVAIVSGQSVGGNSRWYQSQFKHFVHSSGVKG